MPSNKGKTVTCAACFTRCLSENFSFCGAIVLSLNWAPCMRATKANISCYNISEPDQAGGVSAASTWQGGLVLIRDDRREVHLETVLQGARFWDITAYWIAPSRLEITASVDLAFPRLRHLSIFKS